MELRVLTGKHAGDVFCKPNRDMVRTGAQMSASTARDAPLTARGAYNLWQVRVGRFAGNVVCISDHEVRTGSA